MSVLRSPTGPRLHRRGMQQEPRDQLNEASYEHATGLLAGEMEREGRRAWILNRMIFL